MSIGPRTFPEPPEFWLEWVFVELESDKEFLKEGPVIDGNATPGVYLFARRLFGMVECRDVPCPDMKATKMGHFIADWTLKNGDKLFISVVGNNHWRYILNTKRHQVDSIHVVKEDHANTIRYLFEEMFCVNSAKAVECVEKGDYGC